MKRNERSRLISKFMDLGVGDMPELETMPLDQLDDLVSQLTTAQDWGWLDLETEIGIAELKRIVDQFI